MRQHLVPGSEVAVIVQCDFGCVRVAEEDGAEFEFELGLYLDVGHFADSLDGQREHVLSDAVQVDDHDHVVGLGDQGDEHHFDVDVTLGRQDVFARLDLEFLLRFS